ncbi:hypothetical protein AAC387_Pa10g0415 [Persea americana]
MFQTLCAAPSVRLGLLHLLFSSIQRLYLHLMAPKKWSRTPASSSSSRYDGHRFQFANRAMQYEELLAKRNVGSEREIDDKLVRHVW